MNAAVNPIEFNFFGNAYEEADFVAYNIYDKHQNGVKYSEILVIQRRNDDSEFLEIALKRFGVPYKKDILSFFDYEVTKTINMFYNLNISVDELVNLALDAVTDDKNDVIFVFYPGSLIDIDDKI